MRAPLAGARALPAFPLDDRALERVRVRAHRRARTGGTGAHLRRQAGQSQEFREYRGYSPGDDIRFVDWRATFRLGARRPADWVVKTFDAEEALTIVLAVDLRPSMMLPAAAAKLLPALWTVQAIGRLVGRSQDRIVLLPLAGPVALMDQAAGRHALAAADQFAERCWQHAKRSDWETTPPLNAQALLDMLSPAALVVVISDLYLSDEDTDALSDLLHRCQQSYREVVVVVPDSWPYEEALLRRGPVKMRALEGISFPDETIAFAPQALVEVGRSIAAHHHRCLARAEAGGLSSEAWPYPAEPRLDGRALADAFRGWFDGAEALFDALGGAL